MKKLRWSLILARATSKQQIHTMPSNWPLLVIPWHCDRFNGASLGNANEPADKKHLDRAQRNFNDRIHLGSVYDG